MDSHIKSKKYNWGKVFEIANTKINLADGGSQDSEYASGERSDNGR